MNEVEVKENVNVPDVIGKNITEATKILKKQGFEIKINNETENLNKYEILVTEQIPYGEIETTSESCVYLN